MFAIVDIETTSSLHQHGKIIEVAVVFHDGEKVTGEYSTLVNPEGEIPPFIRNLTGINEEMVSTAPTFAEIAGKLSAMLQGKNFIAHNVNFDYHFLREEFRRCGMLFKAPRACTIRLSRQLIPGLPSYGLSKISRELGIINPEQHRAYGDARATAELFSLLLSKDQQGLIRQTLKHGSGEYNLPPMLCAEDVKVLPKAAGVYIFKGSSGEVIYVGKATNIRKRVKTHFTTGSASRQKRQFLDRIAAIDFVLTGSEILSTLLEASLIRKHWPRFNESLKVPGLLYGIFRYSDQHGIERLAVNKAGKWSSPYLTFRSQLEARNYLSKLVAAGGLCPRLCGLQPGSGACEEHKLYTCQGICRGVEEISAYNQRLENFLTLHRGMNVNGIIVEKGRNEREAALIWCRNAIPEAYGFISTRALKAGRYNKCCFQPLYKNPELNGTISTWLEKVGDEAIVMPGDNFEPVLHQEVIKQRNTSQLALMF